MTTTTGGLRARVRAGLIQEIKDEARRQMGEEGANAISLRAIARELGMVSSGIYRYFKSREGLLTALIIDAYDDLGEATEAADAACARDDLSGRWRAGWHAVRDWALEHPHEYALIYGSPIPGYCAPEETNDPARRVTLVMIAVVRDAAASGNLRSPFVPTLAPVLSKSAANEAALLEKRLMGGVPEDAIFRAIVSWAQIFGTVSFEVFGRLETVVGDVAAVFDQAVTEMAAYVGIVPTKGARNR